LILENICKKEKLDYYSSQLKQISDYSNRNLNTAINLLQYISIISPSLLNQSEIIDFKEIVEIDRYLAEINELLLNKNSAKKILLLRTKIYNLLVHCVEPIDLMKRLFKMIIEEFTQKSYDMNLKYQLVNILSKYENTLKQGSKPIYHLEGFIISVIELLSINNLI
jgi:replication factor C subunit 3/5